LIHRPVFQPAEIVIRKVCLQRLSGGDDLLANRQQLNAVGVKAILAGDEERRAAARKWVEDATGRQLIAI
jgi:hypothetical protein